MTTLDIAFGVQMLKDFLSKGSDTKADDLARQAAAIDENSRDAQQKLADLTEQTRAYAQSNPDMRKNIGQLNKLAARARNLTHEAEDVTASDVNYAQRVAATPKWYDNIPVLGKVIDGFTSDSRNKEVAGLKRANLYQQAKDVAGKAQKVSAKRYDTPVRKDKYA